MANKKRRCRECKAYKEASKGLLINNGFYCDISCATNYAYKNKEKGKKIKHREQKKAIKTKAQWLAELQALFNKYVRLRDANDGCISCDKPYDWQGQWHASHYYSRGHSAYLRFNLWNVHKSCSVCNSRLSGNIGAYTPRLIEKIGKDKASWLKDHKSTPKSFDIEWIERAIKITRKAIKRVNK